jgi:hypothetical protein
VFVIDIISVGNQGQAIRESLGRETPGQGFVQILGRPEFQQGSPGINGNAVSFLGPGP